jgi:hypothetical protein
MEVTPASLPALAYAHGADIKNQEAAEVWSEVLERDVNGGKAHHHIETFCVGQRSRLKGFPED